MEPEEDIDPQLMLSIRCLAEMIDSIEIYEDVPDACRAVQEIFYRLSQEEAFEVILLAVVKLHELIISSSGDS